MEVGKREDALAETIDFPISIKRIKEVTTYLDTKVVHKQWEVMFEDAKHTRRFTDIHWGVLRMVVRLYHNTNGLMSAGKMHEIIKNLYMQTSQNKKGANIGSINVGDIVTLKGAGNSRYKVLEKRRMTSSKLNAFMVESLDKGDDPIGTKSEYSENQLKKYSMETGGNIHSILAEYKKHIDNDYKNNIVRFKNDKKMVEMFKQDKADHYSVMEYMKSGSWNGAYKEWAGMDTASREEITNDAYDLLNEKNGYPKYAKGSTIKGLFSKAKELTKRGVGATKKAIHDKKKGIALDVLYETKENLAEGRDEKNATEKAFRVVDERFAKGGGVSEYKIKENGKTITLFSIEKIKGDQMTAYKGIDKDGKEHYFAIEQYIEGSTKYSNGGSTKGFEYSIGGL